MQIRFFAKIFSSNRKLTNICNLNLLRFDFVNVNSVKFSDLKFDDGINIFSLNHRAWQLDKDQ